MEEVLSKARSEKYIKLKEIFSKIAGFTHKDALHDLERLEELMIQIPKVAQELEARGLQDRKSEIDANFEEVDGKKLLAEIFGAPEQVEMVEEIETPKIEVEDITLKEGALAFGRSYYRGSARMNGLALTSLMVSVGENLEYIVDESNAAAKKILRNQKETERGIKYFLRDMSNSVIGKIERSMDKDDKNANQYTDIKDVLDQINIEENEP